MNESIKSRREFLATVGAAGAASEHSEEEA